VTDDCAGVSENSPRNVNGSKTGKTFSKFASSKLSIGKRRRTSNGSAKLVRIGDIIRPMFYNSMFQNFI